MAYIVDLLYLLVPFMVTMLISTSSDTNIFITKSHYDVKYAKWLSYANFCNMKCLIL